MLLLMYSIIIFINEVDHDIFYYSNTIALAVLLLAMLINIKTGYYEKGQVQTD